jgi:hypothetical protein
LRNTYKQWCYPQHIAKRWKPIRGQVLKTIEGTKEGGKRQKKVWSPLKAN